MAFLCFSNLSFSLLLGRLKSRDRLERESMDFHERVRQEFLSIALLDPERYLVIDGKLTIEQIHAAIVERVTTLPLLKKNIKS